ncbi:Arc family DNA-binding protein [Sinirhodobacter ferrireducens]|uniref:Arc family DNA-binding protein n=1 Tax=Paenirhodobacter ferrireducens TaxID=1215032 RepID=A0A443L707_9RHOB|nr:Arc family DNA-binding protein [Sinirhodobacter ferrireducens]RWR44970.1 Arc family DNA-binding protein [Sinirhodobacter ferrireducens]
MARSKNEETGQIVIRPPAGMRARIKAAAEANNRSMNAEIVATLEEKYPAPDDDLDSATMTEWMDYVDNATSSHDRIDRIEQINDRLSKSPKYGFLQIKLVDMKDGNSAAFFTTKDKWTDLSAKFLADESDDQK